jgi:hypothetical protein
MMDKLKEAKDKIAVESGFPDWDELYNFTVRSSNPPVIAQLIESYMERACKLVIQDMDNEIVRLKEYEFMYNSLNK